jgi:hypothetical protein
MKTEKKLLRFVIKVVKFYYMIWKKDINKSYGTYYSRPYSYLVDKICCKNIGNSIKRNNKIL